MSDLAGARTLGDLLDRAAASAERGVRLTVEAEDGTTSSLTYPELVAASWQAAGGLAAFGIEPGDRVVVHLPNCLEAVIAWFGLARLGAVFVPTNMALTARELTHVATHSGAAAAIAREAAAPLLVEAGFGDDRLILAEITLPDILAADPPPVAPPPRAEDPIELVYTSGTTAAPKAAIITHANCLFSGRQKAAAMKLGADDRLLSALPICHVNAQSALLAALSAGAGFVLLERYSASGYCEQLTAHGATVTSFVGTQVRTMLRQEPGEFDRSHRVRRAWFALNVSEVERAAFEERFEIRLFNGYGLTEAYTSVTQAPLDGPDHWPSVGAALEGRDVRILGPQGEEVPTGELGEIAVGGVPGRTLMAGYWRDPDATAAALGGGLLHTGDLGRLDADGYLYFVERKANTIKRAGENIAAREVEEVLLEHPAVADAAVVGVPDPIRDEAVKAFVVPFDDATASVEELTKYCTERLAAFKVPTLWSLCDELPRNALGKVVHGRLREDASRMELSR